MSISSVHRMKFHNSGCRLLIITGICCFLILTLYLETFWESSWPEKPERYSIEHVPTFCSKLRKISTELPLLTPSVTRYELNMRADGSIPQDDKKILNYLWDHCDVLLRPPNGMPSLYKGGNPSMGQDRVVKQLLGDVTNGFYVECGALDGILSSNSFTFEKEYGWQGLLIEPDPSNLIKLYGYHRNAWISHSCLSTRSDPIEVIFQPSFDLGRISAIDLNNGSSNPADLPAGTIHVQCFPLYSYLAALNISTVDYFSLDIEGDELEVLQTIPFDKVSIKVISVEFLTSKGGPGPLREFMESKNYITAHKFKHGNRPFDLIFVHKSVNVAKEVLEELAKGLDL